MILNVESSSNYVRGAIGGVALPSTDHIIGFGSNKTYIEGYKFRTPNDNNGESFKKITSLMAQFPEGNYEKVGGSSEDICYIRFIISNNAEAWKTLSVSEGLGLIRFMDDIPYISITSVQLLPNQDYYLFLYLDDSTLSQATHFNWNSGAIPLITAEVDDMPQMFIQNHTSTFQALGQEMPQDSINGWANIINVLVSANGPGKLVQNIFYNVGGSQTSVLLKEYSMKGGIPVSYTHFMERELSGKYDSEEGVKYYIQYFYIKDGERTPAIRIPANGWYAIPGSPKPEQVQVYNQLTGEYNSGSETNFFDTQIRFKAPWDESCTQKLTVVKIFKGEEEIVYPTQALTTLIFQNEITFRLVDLQRVQIGSVQIGSEDEITVYIEYRNSYASKPFTVQLKRCKIPTITDTVFKPIITSKTQFNLFDQLKEDYSEEYLEVSSAWLFGADQGWDTIGETFSLGDNAKQKVSLVLTNLENRRERVFSDGDLPGHMVYKEGDSLKASLALSELFRLPENGSSVDNVDYGISKDKYSGQYTIDVKWRVTNLYGSNYETESSKFVLNFDAQPKSFSINRFQVVQQQEDGENIYATVGQGTYLQEGMTPYLTCLLELYTHEDIQLTLQVNTISANQDANWVDFSTRLFTKDELNFYYSNEQITELQWQVDTIGEIIQETNNYWWRLKIECGSGTFFNQEDDIIEIPVIRHTTPSLRLISVRTDSDNSTELEASYEFLDYGFIYPGPNGIFSYCLELLNSEDEIVSDTKYENGNDLRDGAMRTFILNDEDTDWDFKILKLRLKTTASQNIFNDQYAIEKVVYTNVVNAYNRAPTVAYRTNCVGINSREPLNDTDLEDNNSGVLVVKTSSGRKTIILSSISNKATIDLETGDLRGFVIDCGSWDSY